MMSLIDLWQFIAAAALALAVLSVSAILVFICTIPRAYSHFEPRRISREAFASSDCTSENAQRSGYAYFSDHKPSTDDFLRCETSVQVVVLGDIGRSPRMQYHALSIARRGGLVDIIGYTGAELHPDLAANRFVNVIPLLPFPAKLQFSHRLLFLLITAPCKILWQTIALYYALAYAQSPAAWLLLQNPPAIPTLAVAQLVCFLRNTRLIIDWHNFGHSILALRLGPTYPFVRLARWYEIYFARGAKAHFAVTNAMTKVLQRDHNISGVLPLHDRPAAIYQPFTDARQRQDFLSRLPETKPYAENIRTGHTRLIVSSTSWTPDEDFSVLLAALEKYAALREARQQQQHTQTSDSSPSHHAGGSLPALVAIITGRGPQREYYLQQIAALTASGKLPGVTVLSAWLTPADYAALLASADLGISLHTSSSGVDLPMKVVDMFGAGLPVAGWSAFEAWEELVVEGVNGRGFASVGGLVDVLVELFEHSGDNDGEAGAQLKTLRKGALRECERRWEDEWGPVAGKVLGLKED